MVSLGGFLRGFFKGRFGAYRFASREALVQWQRKRVQEHLELLRVHIPYFRGRDFSTLEALDVMNKTRMMECFDQLNSAGLNREELLSFAFHSEAHRDFSQDFKGFAVGLSSGTSGNRGLFVVSPYERYLWAGYVLGRLLPRRWWQPQRIALLLRAGGSLYESVARGPIHFRYFDLFQPLVEHWKALECFQPSILVAPPYVLRQLAEVVAEGKLRLSPSCVISVAEVLDPLDEQIIQRGFRTPVHQLYQATEGCIASTCSEGTLHLHEDVLLVEQESLSDGSNRFVPVITDLYRLTQPIIRYRLDDVLVRAARPCPCGSVFTALAGIEGRCDDLLVFPSDKGGAPVTLYPDFVRQVMIASTPEVREYRVVQCSTGQVQLQISPELEDTSRRLMIQGWRELLRAQGAALPTFTFRPWSPLAPGEKMRRVYRERSVHDGS